MPTNPNGGEGAHGHDGGGRTPASVAVLGSVIGGIFGAILRGGVVDGDHCDPRTDGRRGDRRFVNPQTPYPPVTSRIPHSVIPRTISSGIGTPESNTGFDKRAQSARFFVSYVSDNTPS